MKLVKKLLGENEVEAVLQRLDRLTGDEARTTAAQTLEVVYGLVQNIRVVMDGEQMHYTCSLLTVEHLSLQTAKHQSTVFEMSSVHIFSRHELLLCLTAG